MRVFAGGAAEVIAGVELRQARARGAELYISHFATCPEYFQWQQRREGPR